MHSMERSAFTRTHQPGARREADMRKSGEKPRVYNYFAHQLYQMAASEMEREEATRRSASAASSSPSSTQQGQKPNGPTSTSTPKRRRKEDGNDARVRFSPEKRLVDAAAMMKGASSPLLLDEDEMSQLVGTSISQPSEWKKSRLLQEVNPFDELSYSDSEVEEEESACHNINKSSTDPPAVARNLCKELMWESLEEEEDDIDIDGGCKLKLFPTQPEENVVVFDGPLMTMMSSPRKKASPTLAAAASSPNVTNDVSPRNSLVGRVMTVEKPATVPGSSSRRKKQQRPPPLQKIIGRQVSESECSELTMEGLPSEETSCSQSHSGDTYSSDGQGCEFDSTSSSSDTRDWYDSSEEDGTSSDSVDSGVMSPNMEPYALRRDSRPQHHPRENQMDKPGLWMYDNRQQASTCRRSLHPIMQKQQQQHKQPHRSRSNKKRKGGHHINNSSNHVSAQADHHSNSRSSSSNLFPLSHLTDSFKSRSADENDSLERTGSGSSKHRNGTTETSLLMDLSHELQEMVVIAGNSGGEFVASLFHQLCEE